MAFTSSVIAFDAPVKSHLIKLCPTIEIIAVVAGERHIDGYRFDGSHAFGYDLRTTRADAAAHIVSLAWQPDGLHLWVAWSDGLTASLDTRVGRAYGFMNTRPGSQPKDNQSTPKIVSHSHGRNLVHPQLVNRSKTAQRTRPLRPSRSNDGDFESAVDEIVGNKHTPTLEAFTGARNDEHNKLLCAPSGLPRQLATIDLQMELPRLSPLPHVDDRLIFGAYAPNRFVTQPDVDAAFPWTLSQLPPDNVAEFAVMAWSDNSVSFISPDLSTQKTLPGEAAMHATHPFSSCHAFLCPDNAAKQDQLVFVSLDAMRQSSHYFHYIPRYMTSLDSLANYVLHSIGAIRHSYKTATDLPTRFLNIAKDDLAASAQPWHLDAALYHQAVTGSMHPAMRAWLIDVVQERGLKRWEAAVTQGLDDVVRLLHTHLLPALERLTLVASRLRGLARMSPPHVFLAAAPARLLTRVLDCADILRAFAHRTLTHAADEQRASRTLISWLFEQAALARAEPNSGSARECLERLAGVDHSALLAAISGPLLRSHLHYFLAREPAQVLDAPRRPAQQIPRRVAALVADKHAREALQPPKDGQVEAANLLWQGHMLADAVRDVRDAPGQGLARAASVCVAMPLARGSVADEQAGRCMSSDVRLVCEEPVAGMFCTYVVSASARRVHLQRTLHSRHLEPLSTLSAAAAAASSSAPNTPTRARSSSTSAPRAQTTRALRSLALALPPQSGTPLAARLLSDDALLLLCTSSAGPRARGLQVWVSAYGRAAGCGISLGDAEDEEGVGERDVENVDDAGWALVREWAPFTTASSPSRGTDEDDEDGDEGVQVRLVQASVQARLSRGEDDGGDDFASVIGFGNDTGSDDGDDDDDDGGQIDRQGDTQMSDAPSSTSASASASTLFSSFGLGVGEEGKAGRGRRPTQRGTRSGSGRGDVALVALEEGGMRCLAVRMRMQTRAAM